MELTRRLTLQEHLCRVATSTSNRQSYTLEEILSFGAGQLGRGFNKLEIELVNKDEFRDRFISQYQARESEEWSERSMEELGDDLSDVAEAVQQELLREYRDLAEQVRDVMAITMPTLEAISIIDLFRSVHSYLDQSKRAGHNSKSPTEGGNGSKESRHSATNAIQKTTNTRNFRAMERTHTSIIQDRATCVKSAVGQINQKCDSGRRRRSERIADKQGIRTIEAGQARAEAEAMTNIAD